MAFEENKNQCVRWMCSALGKKHLGEDEDMTRAGAKKMRGLGYAHVKAVANWWKWWCNDPVGFG